MLQPKHPRLTPHPQLLRRSRKDSEYLLSDDQSNEEPEAASPDPALDLSVRDTLELVAAAAAQDAAGNSSLNDDVHLSPLARLQAFNAQQQVALDRFIETLTRSNTLGVIKITHTSSVRRVQNSSTRRICFFILFLSGFFCILCLLFVHHSHSLGRDRSICQY